MWKGRSNHVSLKILSLEPLGYFWCLASINAVHNVASWWKLWDKSNFKFHWPNKGYEMDNVQDSQENEYRHLGCHDNSEMRQLFEKHVSCYVSLDCNSIYFTKYGAMMPSTVLRENPRNLQGYNTLGLEKNARSCS